MSPQKDERRPWQGAGSSSSMQVAGGQVQRTTPVVIVPSTAPRHVLAETHVVSGRFRSRLLLLVVCECRAIHVHYGPLGMVAAVRQAACGRRYTVHTGYELASVAS